MGTPAYLLMTAAAHNNNTDVVEAVAQLCLYVVAAPLLLLCVCMVSQKMGRWSQVAAGVYGTTCAWAIAIGSVMCVAIGLRNTYSMLYLCGIWICGLYGLSLSYAIRNQRGLIASFMVPFTRTDDDYCCN